MSPGHFQVSLLILTVLWRRSSKLFLLSPVIHISFWSPWGLFEGPKIQLIPPSHSCFIASWVSWQNLSFRFFFIFTQWSAGMVKLIHRQVLLLLLINTSSSLLNEIQWAAYISKSQNFMFHILEQILVFLYTICKQGQILTPCTIPIWSLLPLSHAYYNYFFYY